MFFYLFLFSISSIFLAHFCNHLFSFCCCFFFVVHTRWEIQILQIWIRIRVWIRVRMWVRIRVSSVEYQWDTLVDYLALVVRPGNTQPKQPAVRAANQARLGLDQKQYWQATQTDDRRLRDAETQRRAWSVEAAAAPAELNYPTRCRYEKQLIARPRSTNWTELNWAMPRRRAASNAGAVESEERPRAWVNERDTVELRYKCCEKWAKRTTWIW